MQAYYYSDWLATTVSTLKTPVHTDQAGNNAFLYPFISGASHLDNFPEDLRSVVHDHWGTFPPQVSILIILTI
jgi:hypothetical protein